MKARQNADRLVNGNAMNNSHSIKVMNSQKYSSSTVKERQNVDI
jgi:hypothetical protein